MTLYRNLPGAQDPSRQAADTLKQRDTGRGLNRYGAHRLSSSAPYTPRCASHFLKTTVAGRARQLTGAPAVLRAWRLTGPCSISLLTLIRSELRKKFSKVPPEHQNQQLKQRAVYSSLIGKRTLGKCTPQKESWLSAHSSLQISGRMPQAVLNKSSNWQSKGTDVASARGAHARPQRPLACFEKLVSKNAPTSPVKVDPVMQCTANVQPLRRPPKDNAQTPRLQPAESQPRATGPPRQWTATAFSKVHSQHRKDSPYTPPCADTGSSISQSPTNHTSVLRNSWCADTLCLSLPGQPALLS